MTERAPWYEEVTIPALLRHARVTYGSAMRRSLEVEGYDDIPRNGLYVIGGLALGDGHVPLGNLIRDLRISKQAAGQLVDTLVARGYLDRTVDPHDRRRLNITLTERGRAAAAIQGAARDAIDTELLARTGEGVVGALRQALATLIEIGRRREAGAVGDSPEGV